MMTFREIVEQFKLIQSVNGRIEKEAILKKNMNDEGFNKVLQFLYNPYILTGLKSKKMMKFADYISPEETFDAQFDNPYQVISYLKVNNTGSDSDVRAVMNFINTYDTDIDSPVHDFLQELYSKEFKCGITASTINKVYGKGWIPQHKIMLAKSWDDEHHKVEGDFIITPKLDGLRCTSFVKDGKVKFYTRKGLEIKGMVELEEEMLKFPEGVYDGELLIVDKEGLLDRLERFRATQKRVRTDGEKRDIEYHLYEAITHEDFANGKSKEKAFARKFGLEAMIKGMVKLDFIKHVPMIYIGSDKGEVTRLLKEALDRGEEGIMVTPFNSKYECKRTSNLLKAKQLADKTIDLRVVGFVEGTGKYKGTLGRLNLNYKGNILGVGSGLTDKERDYIWNNQEEILGSIVEVKYDDFSENEDGEESLRYPIFIAIRDDKEEESYYA